MTGLTLIAYAFHFGFFQGLELQSVDMRFSLRGTQSTGKNIVIVSVDPTTFSDLRQRWPFNRKLHAKIIDRICAAHPKVIAMDIVFDAIGTVEEDNALGTAIYNCNGKVALAAPVSDKGDPVLVFDQAALRQFHAKAGDYRFATDQADVIRKMPFALEGLKSLGIAAAEIASGKTVTRSQMGGSSQWIDFAGPPGTIRTYSYSHVLPLRVLHRSGPRPWRVQAFGAAQGTYLAEAQTRAAAEKLLRRTQVPVSAFKGKVVVVGGTDSSLQAVADIHATSTGTGMPGPEIQANAIQTTLRGFPLRGVGTVWDVVLIVCLGFVVPLASLRVRPMIALAIGLLFAAIFIPSVMLLAFNEGEIASFVYPLSALILSTVGAIAIHYIITAFEKERVRDVFSRFVPDTVVDQVLEQSGEDLRIGGREVVGTVMFSDLRGFTSSAEFMPADKVIAVLNHYLHEMSEAILKHGGTLLCYMGDGIYALFGAPLDQDDHADRALAASREMVNDRLPAFNRYMQEMGLGTGYFMGVVLNSGPVMTGNVGHERRMDYTAVGDVVNTASRIEGMTKETPYYVLIAESTVESLRSPPADIVFHEEQSVRGRQEKLKLYALDIKKPDTAPGTDVAAAKPAEWKTDDEPAPDAPPAPALG